jgi:hypothetical protein
MFLWPATGILTPVQAMDFREGLRIPEQYNGNTLSILHWKDSAKATIYNPFSRRRHKVQANVVYWPPNKQGQSPVSLFFCTKK